MGSYQKTIENLLAAAGVEINGKNPWDIRVNDNRLYQRILTKGSVGLGEAYMEGWWDSESLDVLFFRILRADLEKRVRHNFNALLQVWKAVLFNQQTKRKAFEVAKKHYDAGNELFMKMLDKRMIYSCAYWKDASNLDEAQENKLDLICRKLKLSPGMRLLDIGCGWGGLAKFATEKYDVSVVGITVSKEQAALAKERCRNLPVEIRLQDYRSLHDKFERIVSVGMFEHVGYKNYGTYMNVVDRNLMDGGLFLLHCIGGNESRKNTDPWIHKYIFPNGMMPSIEQISKAIEGKFIMEDWHNFGTYYDPTLMAWLKNFQEAWPSLKNQYNDEFYRMWRYYLCVCAASFRARKNNLWQIVLSKGNLKGYCSVR